MFPHRFIKPSGKAGLPPGSLVHIGEKPVEPVSITVMDYDAGDSLRELCLLDPDTISQYRDSPSTTWININGIHDKDVIRMIGSLFSIHPLTLEDLMNTTQRPKFEEFPSYLFIVLRMLSREDGEIRSEQVSLILTDHCVISLQERAGDVFDPIRARIRNKGRIRSYGSDFLCYSLIDTIVDEYFGILESLGDDIEILETTLLADPNPDTVQTIRGFKRDLIMLRKAIWPLREVLSAIERTETPLISAKTGIYFRDIYDHTIQVIDAIESLRDITAGMLDLYLSTISFKMNEVMKVLTIIATIFIPLTFIAGVYGMNFMYMPELEWTLAYPAVLALMFGISILMLAYFRKKRWI
ncbi:magnesium transporter [Methanocalculus alkaliphilus]|uniref:magnesium/cobalt transporter CorA n=1 Tax=Methanocalculus alkaliphilus TaxID=768730 RepID=UPI0020A0564A|nr:magnesium/cobalt transporter CorA [Methanocalculus alkaliphilus]MCP1715543.1 magnesium transporter [Methanocalculus alkaliphilus]